MGWSCTLEAAKTLEALTNACIEATGTQNQFRHNGELLFFEHSRREHEDGAVTGSVFNMKGRRVGSFKISADGKILNGNRFFSELLADECPPPNVRSCAECFQQNLCPT